MAQPLHAEAPTRRPLPNDLDLAALAQARLDLAASLRMAARLGLHEGVCNHFSLMVPGRNDLFLVNPLGLAFSEVTASSLLVCDFDGNVVEGEGAPEATAFYIHARIHARHPRARAVFHTHMPNATALCMVAHPPGQGPLAFAGQTALRFLGRVALDDVYGGIALDNDEGDRIAAAMGNADVVFMRSHGVIVAGATAAKAWDDLYYLERAAEVQIRAMSTGLPLVPVEPTLAATTAAQMEAERADSSRLAMASVHRILMREEPDFAD